MARTPKAKTSTTDEPASLSRRQQFAQTYEMAKRSDPAIGRWVAGAGLLAALAGFAVFWVLVGRTSVLGIVLSVFGGLMIGVLTGLIIFSRRAQKAVYGQMEGQAGAAAGALGLLKRGWTVDNAIAFSRQQDVVHRVIGPPGIVLIGEGNAGRVKTLLAAERRRHERVATGAPVHEIVCGSDEDHGQVPLAKLARRVQKMKRQVQPAEITDIKARLKAIDASRPTVPMPKGPLPTSMKGLRGNMKGR